MRIIDKTQRENDGKIYRQSLRRGRRQSLASPPGAWSAHPGSCPTRLGWTTAGTERSPADTKQEGNGSRWKRGEANQQRANQRERVHLGVVHDNGLPRWELQSTVPLVGGHGLLILGLDWAKVDLWTLEKVTATQFFFYYLSVCQSDADLQFFTEVLGVRNEAAVGVPFVEPGAAPDLRRLLLPIDGGPYAVIQLHVVSPSVRPHDHILWVWLNWREEMKTDNNKNHSSAHPRFTLLCFTGEATFEQRGGAVPELYVSSSWRESMMLKGSQIHFDSTCLQ